MIQNNQITPLNIPQPRIPFQPLATQNNQMPLFTPPQPNVEERIELRRKMIEKIKLEIVSVQKNFSKRVEEKIEEYKKLIQGKNFNPLTIQKAIIEINVGMQKIQNERITQLVVLKENLEKQINTLQSQKLF